MTLCERIFSDLSEANVRPEFYIWMDHYDNHVKDKEKMEKANPFLRIDAHVAAIQFRDSDGSVTLLELYAQEVARQEVIRMYSLAEINTLRHQMYACGKGTAALCA